MSITLVHSYQAVITNPSNAITITTPGSGHALICLFMSPFNGDVTGITGGGVTWANVINSPQTPGGSRFYRNTIWVGYNSSGSGTTVTVSNNGTNGGSIVIFEVSGLNGVTKGAAGASGFGGCTSSSHTIQGQSISVPSDDYFFLSGYNYGHSGDPIGGITDPSPGTVTYYSGGGTVDANIVFTDIRTASTIFSNDESFTGSSPIISSTTIYAAWALVGFQGDTTTTKTLTGKANIILKSTQTLTGKANIQQQNSQTLTGKSRITIVTNKFQSGHSNIRNTTDQTITGVANLVKTSTQTLTGVSRIQKITNQTLTGKSRITQVTNKTLTGVANILITTQQTQMGISRISAKSTQTITGVANLLNNSISTKTMLGKARIQIGSVISMINNPSRSY